MKIAFSDIKKSFDVVLALSPSIDYQPIVDGIKRALGISYGDWSVLCTATEFVLADELGVTVTKIGDNSVSFKLASGVEGCLPCEINPLKASEDYRRDVVVGIVSSADYYKKVLDEIEKRLDIAELSVEDVEV